MKRLHLFLVLLGLAIGAFVFKSSIKTAISPVMNTFTNKQTVAGRLNQFGAAARGRLKPAFDNAKTAYPPPNVR